MFILIAITSPDSKLEKFTLKMNPLNFTLMTLNKFYLTLKNTLLKHIESVLSGCARRQLITNLDQSKSRLLNLVVQAGQMSVRSEVLEKITVFVRLKII